MTTTMMTTTTKKVTGVKRPSALLAIMARTEAEVIDRAVESAAEQVAGALLLDTGSTDETREVFVTTCEHYGLPYRIESAPFVDFGTTRSVLLEQAEEYAPAVGAEWVLQLDADETLESYVGGVSVILGAATDGPVAIGLEHRAPSSPSNWWVPKLTRVGCGYSYAGVIHEILMLHGKPARWETVVGAVVYSHFDSFRNRDPLAKYQQDLALLLSAPVVHGGHHGLHVGQTYEALASRVEAPLERLHYLGAAADAYQAALAHLQGSSDRGERYWCLLRLGAVREQVQRGFGIEDFLRAQAEWPERVEATAYLAEAYRTAGAPELARQHLQIAWENLCESPVLTGQRVDYQACNQVAERAQLEFALGNHAFARMEW